MTKQVIWTEQVLETFIREANLSEIEEKIMRSRVEGWTRTKQAMQLHLSLSTIDYYIKILKIKYDAVARENPAMPPRRQSAKELYMDTH